MPRRHPPPDLAPPPSPLPASISWRDLPPPQRRRPPPFPPAPRCPSPPRDHAWPLHLSGAPPFLPPRRLPPPLDGPPRRPPPPSSRRDLHHAPPTPPVPRLPAPGPAHHRGPDLLRHPSSSVHSASRPTSPAPTSAVASSPSLPHAVRRAPPAPPSVELLPPSSSSPRHRRTTAVPASRRRRRLLLRSFPPPHFHPPPPRDNTTRRMAAATQAFKGNMKKALAGIRRSNLDGLRWRVFDAKGQVLGRLASQIATVVQGKDKPTYTPYLEQGDMCVIVNAKDICVTGRKLKDKIYYWHTGHIGHLRQRNLKDQLEKDPTEVIRKAVLRMLPRNKLRDDRDRKLRIFAGPYPSVLDPRAPPRPPSAPPRPP